MKLLFNVLAWILFLLDHVASGVGSDEVSVSAIDGDSVTLHTGVESKQQEDIKWYFSSTRIAQISGDLSLICTDVQCNEGTERFRDRLKLNNQTGSLTIMNITNTDPGEYKLKIIRSSSGSDKIFHVIVSGVPAAEQDEVKRNGGESVSLDSGETRKPNDVMTWFFKDTLIAQMTGDPNKTCTDVQCNNETERFRDRLKLDHQTGSLNITDTRTTDSGLYELKIIRSTSSSDKIFNVTVNGVSAAERDNMKRKSMKEGESVSLESDETKNPKVMTWYFNDTRIAEITGDQSKICTDDQCKDRFRDRLDVDLFGSLTITNTRTTDSGLYTLQIIISDSRFSITREKRFSVTVTDSGLSSDAVAGICVGVFLFAAVALIAGLIYRRRRRYTRAPQNDKKC